MQKEGKVDILSVLVASIVIFIVYAVLVTGIRIDLISPGDNTFNSSGTNAVSKNINFTFNVTWDAPSIENETPTNCSL